ncbi:ATP-binding protein [Natronobiforma cellulositropha]|uniref:ATP-binding protein n=1 Tax=Natronobiforma cellulositropha TaxID=1679076 RepID=UPI0021D5A62B|nr:DUF87 domain-containing protein [Natronobiforma cellulositropha]
MAESIERLAVSADGFTLPVEDVLTGRGFVTGKSGSGKSNTASVVAEELLERGLGMLIVDTDGEYRGLSAEYDLLTVGCGEECDVDLESSDVDRLVSRALEERIPMVLDLSTYLETESAEDALYAVVRALFAAEGEYRLPYLLFLEEAHEFLPQSGGANAELKRLLVRVAKRGRKRGLGICCLSQRPAAVDKDYVTQCDWFVWHRLTWENDTAVVGRILGGDAEDTVQSLADGEALVLTDWDESVERVQFRRKRTEDGGSTPSLEDLYADSRETALERVEEASFSDESAADESTPEPAADAGSDDEVSESAGDASNEGRTRHETPPSAGDPLWEVAAMVVYLYDSLAAVHGRALRRLERALARAVVRLDDLVVGRPRARRASRLERVLYRVLALSIVLGAYALALFVLFSVV